MNDFHCGSVDVHGDYRGESASVLLATYLLARTTKFTYLITDHLMNCSLVVVHRYLSYLSLYIAYPAGRRNYWWWEVLSASIQHGPTRKCNWKCMQYSRHVMQPNYTYAHGLPGSHFFRTRTKPFIYADKFAISNYNWVPWDLSASYRR